MEENRERRPAATIEEVTSLCERAPDLATTRLHELVNSNGADVSALTLAAYGFHLLDRHDAEVNALERRASLEPEAYGSWNVLGDALMEVGREDEARHAFQEAFKLCTGPLDTAQLAQIVAGWGLYDLCVQVTRRWTVLESHSPAAHELLGFSFGMLDDHAAAADAFRTALQLDPDAWSHRRNLSYALAKAGRMLDGWRAFWGDPIERRHGPSVAPLFEEPIEIDWPSMGGELIRRITYEGEGRLPLLSSESGAHQSVAGAFVVQFESPALRTKLVIEPSVSDVQCSLVSMDSAPVQDPDLELWRSIVRSSLDAMGEDQRLPWFAIIGTRPMSSLEAPDQQLTAPGHLGDFDMYPCPRVREHNGSPALRNEVVRQISPIAVEGVCHGFHDWGVDAQEEAVAVRSLCAFLSVAWNSAWEVKVAPQVGHSDSLIEKQGDGVVVAADANPHNAVKPVEVEAWMEDAFTRMRHEDSLQDAAHAFHEGMMLLNKHPSVAAMRFVTSCEVLGGRRNPGARSGAKVRATFESVLSHDDAEELWQAYRRRNETAHEAKYHGLELSEGLEGFDPLTTAAHGLAFTLGLLTRLRGTTRDALLRDLRDQGTKRDP